MKRFGLLLFAVLAVLSLMATTKLPVVKITTNTTIGKGKKVSAHMQAGDYNGNIGIKLRGNSSLSFNQKKYTIELRDENGEEKYDYQVNGGINEVGVPLEALQAPYEGDETEIHRRRRTAVRAGHQPGRVGLLPYPPGQRGEQGRL